MITLLDTLRRSAAWLESKGVPQGRLDAERIFAHVLGLERLALYLDHARPLDAAELTAIRDAVRRRGQREPLGWILGTVGFHRIDLIVRAGVLVPRPDTETLVEAALSWFPPGDGPIYVADACTGSGAVGLAIAAADPRARCYLTDVSDEALEVARANTAALGLTTRVAVLKGDLLAPIPAQRPIDLVVANPPYVPRALLPTLEPEVSRWEPRLALDGGADGLDLVRRLIPTSARRARCGVLFEVGHDQADAVSALLTAAELRDVTVWTDLGGNRRVVGGRVDPAGPTE